MILHYNDFIETLLKAGFSMGIGDDGIYAAIPWGFFDEPPYDTPVSWNNPDPDYNRWEWRMRVLADRTDIAYGKVFMNKTGYITREWYPQFLAARRNGATFNEMYEDGKIGYSAKRIYDVVCDNGVVSTKKLKRLAGFGKDEKSPFERAIVELQMGLYITTAANPHKTENYGMTPSMFTTIENFWGEGIIVEAEQLDSDEAFDAIRARVLELNPAAEEKKIKKFILG